MNKIIENNSINLQTIQHESIKLNIIMTEYDQE